MLTFTDGPASPEANGLMVKRSPLYLRVVKDAQGKWDALDQFDDHVYQGDEVYAYRREGDYGHVCVRGKNAGCYALAHYVHVNPSPSREIMADNSKWKQWATQKHREENREE